AHILEANAHINTRAPSWDMGDDGKPRFSFHRGMSPGEGNHIKNGLFHSSFVKVLTNLTDLGPDDGGTVVIAGSHKVDADDDAAIIAAAYADRSLIHQVVAPAGSSLLFTESLLHATGQITSDRERIIIICGYGTTFFPWLFMDSHRPGFALDPAFIARIPAPLKPLFISQGYIQREARYRKLGDPGDERPIQKIQWPDA
ncbi:MAG TPA: phytanoyl-CoA dioxygenase family protein, partial [Abditibacteriaceae bacterium]|nr:phytanoyl-CoA dioxygenase family protein [Abditibacteriaceae bacterium]